MDRLPAAVAIEISLFFVTSIRMDTLALISRFWLNLLNSSMYWQRFKRHSPMMGQRIASITNSIHRNNFLRIDNDQDDDLIIDLEDDKIQACQWYTLNTTKADSADSELIRSQGKRQQMFWTNNFFRLSQFIGYIGNFVVFLCDRAHIQVKPWKAHREDCIIKDNNHHDDHVLWRVPCPKCVQRAWCQAGLSACVYNGSIYVWGEHIGMIEYNTFGEKIRNISLEPNAFVRLASIQIHRDEIWSVGYHHKDGRVCYDEMCQILDLEELLPVCIVYSIEDGKRKRSFPIGDICALSETHPDYFLLDDYFYRKTPIGDLICWSSVGQFVWKQIGIFSERSFVSFHPASKNYVWVADILGLEKWEFVSSENLEKNQQVNQSKKRKRKKINV